MPTLTPADRAVREAERTNRMLQRQQKEEARNRDQWSAKMDSSQLLASEAEKILIEGIESKKITLRDIWLVFAVFEVEEKSHAAGKTFSCKTFWFDKIAPRARAGSGFSGVSGFAARTARRIPQFIRGSGNGYVWLNDLGYALVQRLRKQYPMLEPKNSPQNRYHGIEIEGLGKFPPPLWRMWEDL